MTKTAEQPARRRHLADLGVVEGSVEQITERDALGFFEKACVSRFFELKLAEVYPTGVIKAPIYLSVGHEFVSAVIAQVCANWLIFAQHRAHDYYLAFGGDMRSLIDELLHRQTGCARGMGGSASLHCPAINMFGHSGLMADQAPIAVGAALGSGKRTLCVVGDASAEEDYVISAMGYAATRKLPVLFVCADNDLSILTPMSARRTWELADVAQSLGMHSVDIADDPWTIAHYVKQYIDDLPAFINVRLCRHLWHAGVGCDGAPDWNRFEIVKDQLADLGLGTQADQIEKDAQQRIESAWDEQLHKP